MSQMASMTTTMTARLPTTDGLRQFGIQLLGEAAEEGGPERLAAQQLLTLLKRLNPLLHANLAARAAPQSHANASLDSRSLGE